jgi:hypothetical protein
MSSGCHADMSTDGYDQDRGTFHDYANVPKRLSDTILPKHSESVTVKMKTMVILVLTDKEKQRY